MNPRIWYVARAGDRRQYLKGTVAHTAPEAMEALRQKWPEHVGKVRLQSIRLDDVDLSRPEHAGRRKALWDFLRLNGVLPRGA